MSIVSAALHDLDLSAEEISRRSKLPLDRVKAIMNGEPARLSEVRALSAGLRLAKHLLLPRSSRSENREDLRLLFRSTGKSHETLDLTIERVADYVSSALQVLPVRHDLPSWLNQFQEVTEDYAGARSLANQFRTVFFSGDPNSPLYQLPILLATIEGIILAPLKQSRFEGITLLKDNYFFVFVSPRFVGRMLFTLAHELGHVLAHHDKLITPFMESASEIGNFRKGTKAERFVDAFSSCLLLPEDGVFNFFQVLRRQNDMPLNAPLGDIEILLLARFFGVSFDVAAHRCEALKLLPEGGAFSLSNHLKDQHKSAERRADDLGLPPRQQIGFPPVSFALASALRRKIADGDVSIGWASDRFELSQSELIALNRSERLR